MGVRYWALAATLAAGCTAAAVEPADSGPAAADGGQRAPDAAAPDGGGEAADSAAEDGSGWPGLDSGPRPSDAGPDGSGGGSDAGSDGGVGEDSGGPECECTSGPCCTGGCWFRSPSHRCAADQVYESRCGTESGSCPGYSWRIWEEYGDRYCSGDSASCTGAVVHLRTVSRECEGPSLCLEHDATSASCGHSCE